MSTFLALSNVSLTWQGSTSDHFSNLSVSESEMEPCHQEDMQEWHPTLAVRMSNILTQSTNRCLSCQRYECWITSR